MAIPPVLVNILRVHIDTSGEGAECRVFRFGRSWPLQETAYAMVWQPATRHSVAMLLKRYANCIDGQQLAANERIAGALEDGRV